jgi:hypothetical protein
MKGHPLMTEPQTLFFDVFGYAEAANPHDRMRALGISWEGSEAQPIADQIKFVGCTNIPDPLPDYLRTGKDTRP